MYGEGFESTYRVGTRWLGTTSLAGNNNLVYREHRPCRFRRQLDSPLLRREEVENAVLLGVKGPRAVVVLQGMLKTSLLAGPGQAYLNVNTRRPIILLLMGGI